MRKVVPSWRPLASSSRIAQMPMNVNSDEPAIEPASATASTGRRARSTSPPQTRRKNRAKNVIPASVSAGSASLEEAAKPATGRVLDGWRRLRRFLGRLTLGQHPDVLVRPLTRLLGPLPVAADGSPHVLDLTLLSHPSGVRASADCSSLSRKAH